MPKLIYLKQPADAKPRLAELLGRIRDDDTASYTPFSTAEELAELIESDLAILLASASTRPAGPATQEVLEAPAATDHIPGAVHRRRRSRAGGRDAARLARRRRAAAVTLVGPGGIGKSRLAIEVARSAGEPFDRVTFVMLEHVPIRPTCCPRSPGSSACATPAIDRSASSSASHGPDGATSSCSTASSRCSRPRPT
jgi:hypothetical protein